MKVAVIGGGLIGAERIEAIQTLGAETGSVSLVAVVEPSSDIQNRLREERGIATTSLADALAARPDWVFVCVPHDAAPEIAKRALATGANVLIEKPLGRTLVECDSIIADRKATARLNVGFNFRFYPGIEAAVLDAKSGLFGDIVSVKMTLGHGNAPGMEKTWKLDPVRCGGGCLIDPGVHMLDLVLQLAKGEVSVDAARVWSGFWNTGIEEEAHLLLSDEARTIFALDISLNRWRSTFRLEINGVEGYGIVEGRGRSYGPQTYRRGRRWGWQEGGTQATSEDIVVDRSPATGSFVRETALALDIGTTGSGLSLQPCGHEEGREVMRLLKRVQETCR